jgi:5'-phosphate synthase pdxT subunit
LEEAVLVGVLALQGDFETHQSALTDIGVDSVRIRRYEDGKRLNPEAYVLPGGESSTIDLLGRRYGLDRLLSEEASKGKIIFGTCAGAIWLGRGEHHKVTPLGLIDVLVRRNAYGRQVDSHISEIDIHGLDSPFEAVFIRAPEFEEVADDVQILAEHRGKAVLVRKDNLWLATFHPERTADRRLHDLIFSDAG